MGLREMRPCSCCGFQLVGGEDHPPYPGMGFCLEVLYSGRVCQWGRIYSCRHRSVLNWQGMIKGLGFCSFLSSVMARTRLKSFYDEA